MFENPQIIVDALNILAALFVCMLGLAIVGLLILFLIDRFQNKDAVRHNYPVLGRFRTIFISLGEFSGNISLLWTAKNYRSIAPKGNWVYNSANDTDNTVAFGSTKIISQAGTPHFCELVPFPTLDTDSAKTKPQIIGPYARSPYESPVNHQYLGHEFLGPFQSRPCWRCQRALKWPAAG